MVEESQNVPYIVPCIVLVASHADVLWLVTWGGTRDEPKNVYMGGY